jgi:hypothetical protein
MYMESHISLFQFAHFLRFTHVVTVSVVHSFLLLIIFHCTNLFYFVYPFTNGHLKI